MDNFFILYVSSYMYMWRRAAAKAQRNGEKYHGSGKRGISSRISARGAQHRRAQRTARALTYGNARMNARALCV